MRQRELERQAAHDRAHVLPPHVRRLAEVRRGDDVVAHQRRRQRRLALAALAHDERAVARLPRVLAQRAELERLSLCAGQQRVHVIRVARRLQQQQQPQAARERGQRVVDAGVGGDHLGLHHLAPDVAADHRLVARREAVRAGRVHCRERARHRADAEAVRQQLQLLRRRAANLCAGGPRRESRRDSVHVHVG